LYAWQTLEEGIGGAVVVLRKIGDAGRTFSHDYDPLFF